MIRIRLKRVGSKKKPFYQLIVIDKRKSNKSKFIERIGYFNPLNTYKINNINVFKKRVKYWINLGATISYRVKNIIKILKL
ncbi:MAG: 30S ribosomal protein S16 [Enterobacteriaceae bacterium PC38]|nr:MAG: 30S ribosomal protein S16 [Enterobacteriaceae bacterium PC38]